MLTHKSEEYILSLIALCNRILEDTEILEIPLLSLNISDQEFPLFFRFSWKFSTPCGH